MRILEETICRICQSVFCCADCRYKHEVKNHAITIKKTTNFSEYKKSYITKSFNGEKESFGKASFFCPICEKQPLILKPQLHNEFILHLKFHHLPLRCQKCFKIYHNINELKEFSKCLSENQASFHCSQTCFTDEASKVTITKATMPSCKLKQSSPLKRQDLNENHVTPTSLINVCWKAKSKLHQEEFISDSVSSIKNISSISNSSSIRSTGMASTGKGKIVRCSSTPVQLEMVFAKPKEHTFNATSGHMSSIQYNSVCESDTSPAFSQPKSQALEQVNRYMKVAGSRPKISAVTPLRQVMSKSIQKAFAEHGLSALNAVNSNAFQRKNIFDSSSSPEIDEEKSPIQVALDLRLSPAVRRSQTESANALKHQIVSKKEFSEFSNLRREILLSAQKLTTESIVITRTEHLSSVSSSTSALTTNLSVNSVKPYTKSTNSSYQSAKCNNSSSSVFKSCSSVEIITATTEEFQQLQSCSGGNVKNTAMQSLTPITRIPGSVIKKKIIKFETPKLELCCTSETQNSPNEFFTPNATPKHYNNDIESPETRKRKLLVKQNLNGRFSPQQKPSIKECAQSTVLSSIENITNDFDDLYYNDEDEVFISQLPEKTAQTRNDIKEEKKIQKPSGLWSIMASVIRLPSLKGKNPKESYKNETYTSDDSNSIIKRCASIAGSLVRSKSLVDECELSSLKRKRTYTTDNQLASTYLAELSGFETPSSSSDFNTSSKRFRIQGRRPIDRMRLNS